MGRFVRLSIVLAAAALLSACGNGYRLASFHVPPAAPMRNVVVYGNVGPTGADGVAPKQIWVAAPSGEHRRLLTNGERPTVSPDGRYVAYFADGGTKLRVILTAGGQAISVGNADDATWSPNSRFLAVQDSSRVVVVDVQTGRPMTTISSACTFAFSPNSQRIAYTTDDDGSCDGDLYVVPTSGGAAVRLTDDHSVSAFGIAWGRPGIAFFRFTPAPWGDIWLATTRKHDIRRLTHEGKHFGPNTPAYFSANGRELLAGGFAVHTATIWAVDIPSGEVRQLKGIGGYTQPLGLSRAGTTVLAEATFNYVSRDSLVEAIPFAGGKAHVIARGAWGASWNASR